MYIAPSSGHISLNLNMPVKFILKRFQIVFWRLEWNAALFERLMEIHSNQPILDYAALLWQKEASDIPSNLSYLFLYFSGVLFFQAKFYASKLILQEI